RTARLSNPAPRSSGDLWKPIPQHLRGRTKGKPLTADLRGWPQIETRRPKLSRGGRSPKSPNSETPITCSPCLRVSVVDFVPCSPPSSSGKPLYTALRAPTCAKPQPSWFPLSRPLLRKPPNHPASPPPTPRYGPSPPSSVSIDRSTSGRLPKR